MEMLEGIALVNLVLDEGKEECWFCKQEPKGDRVNKEDESPASPEGTTESDENSETNDATKLGQNLRSRPTWTVRHKLDPKDPIEEGAETSIVPAAHHLLPGNASVKKAVALHKYMLWRGDNSLNLSGPIGYDINDAKNGMWLPGNYAVRKGSDFKKNWGEFDDGFKSAYAKAVMEKANHRQLHDAHPDYNDNVRSTLLDIAEKLDAAWTDRSVCPVCKKKLKDQNRPPYGLVGRLNRLSAEHKKALRHPEKNRKAINSGYFTSSRVKTVYGG